MNCSSARLTILILVTIILIVTVGVISVVVPAAVNESFGLFMPVKR